MPWTIANIPPLEGRVAVVTGANGGLGLQTARVLAWRGAHVIMVVRRPDRAVQARDAIRREVPGASLEVIEADLASLASVTRAGEAIAAAHHAIDIVVNNAGVMATAEGTTANGHELQLGVNHLGHVALTATLLRAVLGAPAGRVVWLTSTGRFFGPSLDSADPSLAGSYNPWLAYGRSKRAALQVAFALDERFREAGVSARSLAADPGYARTDLQARSVRENPGFGQRLFDGFVRRFGSSALRGALPQLRAATDPDLPGATLVGLRWVLRGDPVPIGVLGPGIDRATCHGVLGASELLARASLQVTAAPDGDP